MPVVELMGVPGAGKTTLANALLSEIGGTGRHALGAQWRQQGGLQRLSKAVPALLDRRVAGATWRFARTLGPGDRVMRRRLCTLPPRRAWIMAQNGLVLLDQGLIQQLWSLLYARRAERVNERRLTRLVAALAEGLDLLLVHVAIDPEVAMARLADRPHGHSALDRLDEASRRAAIDKAARIEAEVLRAVRQAGLDVVSVDGSDKLSHVVATIRARLALSGANLPAPRAVAGCELDHAPRPSG